MKELTVNASVTGNNKLPANTNDELDKMSREELFKKAVEIMLTLEEDRIIRAIETATNERFIC